MPHLRTALLGEMACFDGVTVYPESRWRAIPSFSPNILAGTAEQLHSFAAAAFRNRWKLASLNVAVFVFTVEGQEPLTFLAVQDYLKGRGLEQKNAAGVTAEQAKAINVDPGYFKDCSDAVLLTSRGCDRYDRTFLEGFVTPGIDPQNWIALFAFLAVSLVASHLSAVARARAGPRPARTHSHLRLRAQSGRHQRCAYRYSRRGSTRTGIGSRIRRYCVYNARHR